MNNKIIESLSNINIKKNIKNVMDKLNNGSEVTTNIKTEVETENLDLLSSKSLRWKKDEGTKRQWVSPELGTTIFSSENEKKGLYGGSQIVFAEKTDELLHNQDILKILQENFPNAFMQDYSLYLKCITPIGCGFVAIANAIFESFITNPAKFKQIFGYDMYRTNSNGDRVLNYEPLIIEIFTYKMKTIDGNTNITHIYENIADNDNNITDGALSGNINFKGLSIPAQEELISKFLDSKGVNCKIEKWSKSYKKGDPEWDVLRDKLISIGVTVNDDETLYSTIPKPDDIAKLLSEGKKLICMDKHFALYYIDDKTGKRGALFEEDIGGHYMTITGTTKDGDIIVSSWGQKYILEPSDTNFYIRCITITD